MAATVSNEFWKLRSKHGRDKIFKSPKILQEAVDEYFQATSERSVTEQHWVGKDGDEVVKHHYVPFTIQGLCNFLDISFQTWENYKNKEGYEDYFDVITRAEQIIYQQKFEGPATGFYNPNIIARDLGLVDKKDLTTEGKGINPVIEQIKIVK